MPVHDAYARLTPYELSFPDRDWAGERFDQIHEEAEARGSDPSDPEAFVNLMAAGRALRELRGPDDEGERIHEHGALLYHAYHLRRAGEPVWLLDVRAVRYLVESEAGAGDWTPAAPGPAGYLQLPQHLFWTPGGEGEEARPESLDGVFWTLHDGRLTLLAAMGILPGRPGLSVMPLPEAPWAEAASWTTARMRPEGDDFASDMPGADLENLYQVRTAGEVLKLVARTFWHVDTHPGVVREETPPPEPPSAGPEPSAHPYRRVTLG